MKPYRLFHHPKKSLLDDIFQAVIMNFIFSMREFQSCPLTMASPETEKLLNKFRAPMQKYLPSMVKHEETVWKKSNQVMKNGVKIPLEKYTCAIPRIQNILSTWNIAAEEDFNICKENLVPNTNQSAIVSEAGAVDTTIYSTNDEIQSASKIIVAERATRKIIQF